MFDRPVSGSEHEHKCHNCGNVWSHGDSNKGMKAAHTCQCGHIESFKYQPVLWQKIGKPPSEEDCPHCSGYDDPLKWNS